MNRAVALALLVPLLSIAVACGGDAGGTTATVAGGEQFGTSATAAAETSVPATTVASPTTEVATTVGAAPVATPEAARAVLDATRSSEAWYPRLTGISAGVGLGAPMWFVDIDATGIETDYTARGDVASSIGMALVDIADVDAVNIIARWSDGTIAFASGTSRSGGQLADVVSLPAPPATPADVQSWLAGVYGPSGLVTLGPDETWYSSLTSFGTQDYGSGPELALTTTLTAADVWQLTLLQAALQSTGMLLEAVGITCADGHYVSQAGGSFGGTTEPGRNGYMYPAM
jgi:hypothetical protein